MLSQAHVSRHYGVFALGVAEAVTLGSMTLALSMHHHSGKRYGTPLCQPPQVSTTVANIFYYAALDVDIQRALCRALGLYILYLHI